MKRTEVKEMAKSLKAFSRVGTLSEMNKDELKRMPKEVIIACCSHEIALVWDKLPDDLKNDTDIKQYQFCDEHYNHAEDINVDVNDGPPPKRMFCSFCH